MSTHLIIVTLEVENFVLGQRYRHSLTLVQEHQTRSFKEDLYDKAEVNKNQHELSHQTYERFKNFLFYKI